MASAFTDLDLVIAEFGRFGKTGVGWGPSYTEYGVLVYGVLRILQSNPIVAEKAGGRYT